MDGVSVIQLPLHTHSTEDSNIEENNQNDVDIEEAQLLSFSTLESRFLDFWNQLTIKSLKKKLIF